LDTVQAAVANHFLKELPSVTHRRIRNAEYYDRELRSLSDHVMLPPRRRGVVQVFHTYVIRVRKREALMSYLQRHGVETKIHYPVSIHLQKPCRRMGYTKGDFPRCEEQATEILSLPVHQYLTEEQLQYVIRLLKQFYR
jgi:dTDP-4-amino-4,6-dideoxygalactose transaminase